MSQLYDYTESIEITEFVSLEIDQRINVVENTALDGSYYQQIIGLPAVFYNVTAFVDRTGRAALQTVEASGNLLRITVKRGTYYGRITMGALKFSDRMGSGWYKATLKLAKEA